MRPEHFWSNRADMAGRVGERREGSVQTHVRSVSPCRKPIWRHWRSYNCRPVQRLCAPIIWPGPWWNC